MGIGFALVAQDIVLDERGDLTAFFPPFQRKMK
jgi:hypothetical protein